MKTINGIKRNRKAWLFAGLLCLVVPGRAQQLLRAVNTAHWDIPPANYSGITPLGADSFAVIDDKSEADGFYVFHIGINKTTGEIEHVSRGGLKYDRTDVTDMVRRRNADCEDVVFVPRWNTVFIASEEEQEVKEYTLEGKLTGRRLAIPVQMGKDKITPNQGFEALSYNATTQRFWLTTESALPADGGETADGVRMVSFAESLQPDGQWAYRMEHAELKRGRYYAHGIPALVALDDGRLLVMERELTVPKGYLGARTVLKIFAVNPTETPSIGWDTRLAALTADSVLKKTLVCRFSTSLNLTRRSYANYEGMCLGPKLNDGRQTLILINDSQAGAGNALYHLKDYLKIILLPSDF